MVGKQWRRLVTGNTTIEAGPTPLGPAGPNPGDHVTPAGGWAQVVWTEMSWSRQLGDVEGFVDGGCRGPGRW